MSGVDVLGLVDLNLFPRDDPIYVPAYWAGWTSSNYTVGAHGSKGKIYNINKKSLTPSELATNSKH